MNDDYMFKLWLSQEISIKCLLKQGKGKITTLVNVCLFGFCCFRLCIKISFGDKVYLQGGTEVDS